MTAPADLLRSTSAFLHAIAEAPRPDEVADALVSAFHVSLGTRAAAILPARPPLLVVYAVSGYDPQQVADFEALPIDGDYPATRAFHDAAIAIDPMGELPERYAAITPPTSRGRSMIRRYPDGSSIAGPIIGGGRILGSFTLVCARQRHWTPLELSAISTIGHALGMWLTHPDSGLPDAAVHEPPALTPRQREVLTRAAAGLGNAAIAAQLGCSTSTVKAEIGRILRALGVDDRTAAFDRAAALGLLKERSR